MLPVINKNPIKLPCQ